ncbi:MAG: macro domain-containing protein [bacterium]
MEVQFLVGDLTKMEVDAIVNPANSEGEMGGGVAGAIRKAGGKIIEEEAMEQAPIPIGEAVVTTSGKLKCEYVIHAPTMEVPVQRTSVDKIFKAVQAALWTAVEYEFETLAIPGMGTGTGRIPVEEAAQAMMDAIREAKSLSRRLKKIILVDQNDEMVQAWENAWKVESA